MLICGLIVDTDIFLFQFLQIWNEDGVAAEPGDDLE